MTILIVDMSWKRGSLAEAEFCLPVARLAEKFGKCEIRHFSDVPSASLKKYSSIILSGTCLKDNEFAKFPEKFLWLKDCGNPVLGICAGMQIIGMAFGSRLEKKKEIGMTDVRTVEQNPLFSGRFKAYCLHNYSIRPSKEFFVLAKSGKCAEAIKHTEKPFYGVMFHPEVRNAYILERFISS
jgi:GMP synthase-like glutamine amidotransferase